MKRVKGGISLINRTQTIRYVAVLIMALAILGTVCKAQASWECKKTAPECIGEAYDDNIVIIYAEVLKENPEDEQEYSSGSGTYLDNTHILTNYHVIKDYDLGSVIKVRIGPGEDEVVEAEVVKIEPFTDLAILKVPYREGVKVADILREPLPMGSKVFAAGYSWGHIRNISEGLYLGFQHGFTAHNAQTYHGNSGGALYHMLNGKIYLVGIPSRVALNSNGDVSDIGLSPTAADIADFVQDEDYWSE